MNQNPESLDEATQALKPTAQEGSPQHEPGAPQRTRRSHAHALRANEPPTTPNLAMRAEDATLYPDGSGLLRPVNMPGQAWIVALAFAAVALGIGAWWGSSTMGGIEDSVRLSLATVEENLEREVTYNLPQVATLLDLDNQAILAKFEEEGLTIYNLSAEDESDEQDEGSGEALNIMKLPSDVSLSDAAVMLSRGIANLDAARAAKLLNGSWTLQVDREAGVNDVVRYVDFSSGSVEAAIEAAIAIEGFDPATVSEDTQGVDDAGNTYKQGTVQVGATNYTWRVSAVPLEEVYDIAGLPEESVYVGIRVME